MNSNKTKTNNISNH